MVILVVEDEIDSAELLKFFLEQDGHRIILASDGREALARLAEDLPDLVLTDLMMPLLDGLALAEAMRNEPRYRDIPIVAMTAAWDRMRGGDRFRAIVHKPFDLDKLLGVIRRIAEHRPPGED